MGAGQSGSEVRRTSLRIMSSQVGSDRIGKFLTLPDSSIAYKSRILSGVDRF
jgi:hypothetical protein